MARLGCICGADMTNTEAPSRNRISVFYLSEADAAIHNNPKIKLWDFYSGWNEKDVRNDTFQLRNEPVEYWYCTYCKRVYEVQAESCGRIIRTYEPIEPKGQDFSDDIGTKELLVLTDIEMDQRLSEEPELLLKDYLDRAREIKYYISADESMVYAVEGKRNIIAMYMLRSPNSSQGKNKSGNHRQKGEQLAERATE